MSNAVARLPESGGFPRILLGLKPALDLAINGTAEAVPSREALYSGFEYAVLVLGWRFGLSGAVGAGIGGAKICAGCGVVEYGLAASHGGGIFFAHNNVVAFLAQGLDN